MRKFFTLTEIDEVAQTIQSRTTYHPKVGIILGSGLSSIADAVKGADVIPYGDLPYWPVSTVIGHEGKLVLGELESQQVMVMQGRVHYYEGYEMAELTLPIRVMQRLNVETLIVTNAAGGVNQDYEPGNLMLISDHLNLIGMAGPNPLRGPNLEELGPRFPDMSNAYDPELRKITRQVAAENDITLHEGVYVCLAGPSFETPADLRFLHSIGVDAVGMSTVPEVIVARHAGQKVLGISGISNRANLDGKTITTHEEVLEAGKIIAPLMTILVRGVLRQL
jgi:purine-nucleoside phosphorylase